MTVGAWLHLSHLRHSEIFTLGAQPLHTGFHVVLQKVHRFAVQNDSLHRLNAWGIRCVLHRSEEVNNNCCLDKEGKERTEQTKKQTTATLECFFFYFSLRSSVSNKSLKLNNAEKTTVFNLLLFHFALLSPENQHQQYHRYQSLLANQFLLQLPWIQSEEIAKHSNIFCISTKALVTASDHMPKAKADLNRSMTYDKFWLASGIHLKLVIKSCTNSLMKQNRCKHLELLLPANSHLVGVIHIMEGGWCYSHGPGRESAVRWMAHA